MIWYAMQTVTIYWIIQVYAKLTPDVPKFDIVLFAFLCAYSLTWIISFTIDLLRRGLRRLRSAFGLNTLIGQQRRNHLGVEVPKKVLPRP
jgi:hypothetical protein